MAVPFLSFPFYLVPLVPRPNLRSHLSCSSRCNGTSSTKLTDSRTFRISNARFFVSRHTCIRYSGIFIAGYIHCATVETEARGSDRSASVRDRERGIPERVRARATVVEAFCLCAKIAFSPRRDNVALRKKRGDENEEKWKGIGDSPETPE